MGFHVKCSFEPSKEIKQMDLRAMNLMKIPHNSHNGNQTDYYVNTLMNQWFEFNSSLR